jgi:hypothetical protein
MVRRNKISIDGFCAVHYVEIVVETTHCAPASLECAIISKGVNEMAMQFEDIQKASKEQLEHAATAAASLTRGFQAIATEATDYSKRSLEHTSSYIEKLMGVKSLETAIQIQSEFAKTQLEGFVAQATKMSELYKELAKEAFKPVETAMSQAKGAMHQ